MLSLTRATGEAVRIAAPDRPVAFMLVASMTKQAVSLEFWRRGERQPFSVHRLKFGAFVELGRCAIRLSEFEGMDRGHVRFDFDAPREIQIDRVEGSAIHE